MSARSTPLPADAAATWSHSTAAAPSRRRGWSLHWLAALVVLAMAVTMAAVAAIEFGLRSGEITAAAAALQNERARRAATAMSGVVAEIDGAMRSAAQSVAAAEGGVLRDSFQPRLIDLLKVAPAISSASVLDDDGMEVAKIARDSLVVAADLTNQATSIAFQRARTGAAYVGRPYFMRGSVPYVTVAMPIEWFRGEIAGVLVAEVDLRVLSDRLAAIDLGDSGYVYVVSDQGGLVAHSDLSFVLQNRDLSAIEQVQAALAGAPIPAQPLTSPFGPDVYAATAAVTGADWTVLVETPASGVGAAIAGASAQIALLLLAGLGVLGIAAIIGYRRFLVPLGALRDGATRIVAGDLSHRIALSAHDETSDIADVLNEMARRWQSLDTALNAELERRTGELSAVLLAATHFHDATSGKSEADPGRHRDADEAIALLEGVLASAGISDRRLLVSLQAALCRAYVLAARPAEAREAFKRGIDEANALGDETGRLRLVQAVLSAGSLPQLLPTRLEAGRTALAMLTDRPFDDERAGLAHRHFLDLLEAADFAGARRIAEHCARLGEHGAPMLAASARVMQLMLTAEVETGEATIVAAKASWADADGAGAGARACAQLFGLYREQARLGEWQPLVDQLSADGDSSFAWALLVALAHSDGGQIAVARATFEEWAATGFDAIPHDDHWPATMAWLAELCARVGDERRALALYDLLRPFQGHVVVADVVCLGPADRYLGLLAGARGDWSAASDHYQRALELCDPDVLPVWRTHTLIDQAAALLRGPGEREHAKGQELLKKALAAATEHRLPAAKSRCHALLAKKANEGPAADGLSPGELRVLRHLASGATNRAIGEKLFVSPHTVANHVRSILAKTRSANRTEAASYARRHGLVSSD